MVEQNFIEECVEECLVYINDYLSCGYDLDNGDEYFALEISRRIVIVMDEFNDACSHHNPEYCLWIAKLTHNNEYNNISQLVDLIMQNQTITREMFLGVFRTMVTAPINK